MSQRIVYHDDGSKTCYIDGNEVAENQFFDRGNGQLGQMLSEQKAPHGVSDCTFMVGTGNGRQFENNPQAGDHYKEVTERNGGNINGKKYLSGLARYPGDPEAWVDSRGDVQKLLERRGWGCEGTVNVKPRESLVEPTAGPDVAPDLLDKYTEQVASQFPDSHMIDKQDLKEQVRERIKPKNKSAKPTKATKPY